MARILDMDKKYQIILVVLLLCFALVVLCAVGASWLSGQNYTNLEDIAYVNNDGELAINYLNGKDVKFNKKGKLEYGVAITNTSKNKIYFSINLELNNYNNQFLIKVLDEDNKEVENIKINNKYNGKLLNLYSIGGEQTVRYVIQFNLNKRTKVDGILSVVNETLSSDIFTDTLIDNFSVSVAQSMVGSEVGTKNEGLISTVDNKGTAYYFRGNVKNNYVKIGDFLFRIVRINGDGTIRLVLNDSIGNYEYNTNGIVPEQGMPSLSHLGNTSLIGILNGWVEKNLSEYNAYLVNGDFCTDNDFSYVINESNYSRAYERIYVDNAPLLSCSSVYTGKVGLLSVDEVVYAGAYRNNINKKYYLYNKDIDESYFTSTGLFYNASNMTVININSNGSIGDGLVVNEKAAVRPVINISSASRVNGEGTKDNPYVIVS